ncbi:DUF2339 domain-containing protein [Colwellia psychrerythraea]|uniref:DUF2339 domain-containing protein n=1 Tax=Colwellia psychrerythraea TaxID=28229 RepID=A0A099KP91_COLPS|nr:DUF2339 domain-containing protein [Colwellia psychrerythraea]KGJ91458.1 Protein of unknown function DUF2339, transmembrane [Colwellia psychrerythraea]
MNEEVKALKSELALLKLQFNKRVDVVEDRLNSLLAQEESQVEIQQKNINQVEESSAYVMQEQIPEEVVTVVKTISSDEYYASRDEWEAPTPSEPSIITIFFQSILSFFFDWLTPVTKVYRSYKERGMLGIFLLTLVGIGLTLAGFGYLMQLLIDQLDVGSKSLLMGSAAIFVMGLGVALKIKTRFGEFATAIVTLGILFAYSTVYFSGSIYSLLPSIAVFILYLAIALTCHAIALWLDTKVVAALGVVGIAIMPILSNTISIEPLYYLLSLAFIVCSSLILAYRHLGQWLVHLSLAFTLVSLEWIIGFENVLISAWMVNLFYLLFFAYVIASLLKEKAPINQTLVFLAALVGSTVIVFFQATDIFTTQISFSFLLNCILAITACLFFYKVKRELTPFLILLSASWGVLAIVSAISDAYWGIAWAIEGILLLSIGRKYKISASINQGQILTAIALLYSLSALAIYFPLPALKSVDGWLLSIIIVAVIAIWQRLINNTEVFNELTQNKIKPFLQLLEAVFLSVLVIANANVWLGNWAGAIVIMVQLALLLRAKNCKQVTIEVFAAILILVPLFYAYKGVLVADSYRFMMLPLFAKVSVISAFIQLWLWSEFYRKYQPNSEIKGIAESARILFYMLLPVCWVGSVIRRFDEASLMFLWLSPLLALLLARKVNQPLLFKETKLLTGVASVFFAITIGQLTLLNTIITLLGFSGFFAIAYVLSRKDTTQIYQFICSCGLLSLGFALPNVIGFQTDNMLYGMTFAAIYWASIFNAINLSDHFKKNETFITAINLILVVASWLLISLSVNYVLVPAIFIISVLYHKKQRFEQTRLGSSLKLNGDLFLHSIGAITYVTMFYAFTEYRMDLFVSPALAVHGALILFLKDKRLTTVKYSFGIILLGIIKLAMIDAASALLWQKVILFMGIGIFILAASFWYQKLISREVVADA